MIDDKLEFNEHLKKIKKKIQEANRALMCTRYTLNFKAKLLFYNSFIKSHLEYCSIVYLDKMTKKQMKTLLTLQKQAVRLIFCARKKVHSGKLFKLAKIIPVTELYKLEATRFMFKYNNEISRNLQPKAIHDLIFKKNNVKPRNTRATTDPNRIKIPCEYKKDNCLYKLIDTWNKSKTEFKMAGNDWSLNNMIKNDTLNKIEVCEQQNCELCKFDEKRNFSRYMNA